MNPQLAPAGQHIVLLYTFVDRERIALLLAEDSAARTLASRVIAAAEGSLPGLQRGVISMTTSTSVMRGVYTRATASALG
jgi:hypothetical protein